MDRVVLLFLADNETQLDLLLVLLPLFLLAKGIVVRCWRQMSKAFRLRVESSRSYAAAAMVTAFLFLFTRLLRRPDEFDQNLFIFYYCYFNGNLVVGLG